MLRKSQKIHRETSCAVGACVLALVIAISSMILLLLLSVRVWKTDVLDESAYQGVMVSRFQSIEVTANSEESSELNDARQAFINGGYSQLMSVLQVDRRVLASAYSPLLTPCYIPNHGPCEYGNEAEDMPTSFFVGVVTCERIETTTKLFLKKYTEYVHHFECSVQEEVFRYSEMESFDNVTITMSQIECEEPPMEVGKTYLVWLNVVVGEDGTAKASTLIDGSVDDTFGIVEENGKHWSKNIGGKLIIMLSELNVPLSDFWETDVGSIWQHDILPKAEILYHSAKLVGSDSVKSILSFQRGSAYITKGTSLEESGLTYACLISEELAEGSGLEIGDILPLKTYRCELLKHTDSRWTDYQNTFDPYEGFVEQHDYRVVGIYRTEDDIHDPHAVHPNTIFVPKESLVGDYWRHGDGSSTTLYESNVVVDTKYSLIFPADGVDLLLSEMKKQGMNQDYFIIHDGGYAEAREELGELDDAMEAVQAGGARRMWLVGCCALVILAAMFALVWSAKGAVGRRFSVDTPDRKLFWYLYLRQCLPVTVAVALSSAVIGLWYDRLAVWWMSGWTDAAIAEELLVYLPQEPGVPVVAAVVLAVCFLVALPLAWAGVRRKYHYEYDT